MIQGGGNRNHQSQQPFRRRYRSDRGRESGVGVSYDGDGVTRPKGRKGVAVVVDGGSLGPRRRRMMKWWVSPT